MSDILLVSGKFKIERFPGKGGWTFVALPEIIPNQNMPFGWHRVKGNIDDYYLEAYHLMPMGNGQLFLPLKKEIRKKIKKDLGDTVQVTLYIDDAETKIPEDFLVCLEDEPTAFENFKNRQKGTQQAMIKYIFQTKNLDAQAARMAKIIEKLTNDWPLYDKTGKI